MNFGELQSYLSRKIKTTELVNNSSAHRAQALNDALLVDVELYSKWNELLAERPITFLKKGRLVCGVLQSAYTVFASVTDGSFRITVDGTAYNVDAIDFSAVTSLTEVASTIQTAIQTATSGSETCTLYTDYLVISSGTTGSDSSISLLETSTGTEGTDISGIVYINGASSNHAVSTSFNTASIPDDYLEMIKLTSNFNSGNGFIEYQYSLPCDFHTSLYGKWTIQPLFGTSTMFINETSDITLWAKYRKKLVKMTATSDETGLSSKFDEPIVLLASYRLLIDQDPNDQRAFIFKQDALNILDSLYVYDRRNSQRYTRTIRNYKTNNKMY